MDLRVIFFVAVTVISASGQFYPQSIIDTLQHLHDIEKYGTTYTDGSSNLYPVLNNQTDSVGHASNFSQRLNGTVGGQRNTGGFNHSLGNSRESFINWTMSNMPKGVCTKEVPTASLVRYLDEAILPGNGSDPTLSRITFCCEGYQRNAKNLKKCDPICHKSCDNGVCAAPENCICFPDFVKNANGACVATCPVGCSDGVCQPGNSCRCNQGFQLENGGKFCIPKCSNGCVNGKCTGHEKCTCNNGFSMSAHGTCEAVCSKGCKNGDCVAPEVCNCMKGYERKDGVCQPFCSRGCQDGVCISPEVCQCTENGWSMDPSGTKCIAACDKPCLNGICSGHNKCACKTGFGQDNFDVFRCVPKCDPPCYNGVCSSPNFCLCYAGYVKDRTVKGSQNCVKA